MKEGLSQTVKIACMPSVTGYYKITKTVPFIGTVTTSGYEDIIICKWDINGVDHYGTEAQATADCNTFGYSGLWSTVAIQTFQTNPTNDQAMLNKYIDSSVCGR